MDKGKLTNEQPLKFFLILFGLSIPFWVIDFITGAKHTSLLNFSIIDIITAFIPLIAGCILIYQKEGKSGVYKLFKRIFDFSRITNKLWYLPIIFLPLFIYLLIYIVILISGLPLPDKLNTPFKSIPILFFYFFLEQFVKKLVIWVMRLNQCKHVWEHLKQVFSSVYCGQFGIIRQSYNKDIMLFG